MALQYPLVLPGTNVRNFDMHMETSIGVSQSPFSFRSQRVNWGGDRWLGSVQLPPLTRVQADAWLAFFAALHGSEGTFLLGDPFRSTQRGSMAQISTGVRIDASVVEPSGYTLATRGWTPDAIGVLLKGDLFQAGDGEFARLYMVTEDVDADSSGNATLSIWPRWRKPLTDTPAEKITNGDWEAWASPSDADFWSEVHTANANYNQYSASPYAGTYSLEIEKLLTAVAESRTTGAGNFNLDPGKPYRLSFAVQIDAYTGQANGCPINIFNTTQSPDEHLVVRGYTASPHATDYTNWTAETVSADGIQPLPTTSWVRHEFGIIPANRYLSTDNYQVNVASREAAPRKTRFDNFSVYGPTWDGHELVFTNPRGVWRLRENVIGWSVSDLVTYGIGFTFEEAL